MHTHINFHDGIVKLDRDLITYLFSIVELKPFFLNENTCVHCDYMDKNADLRMSASDVAKHYKGATSLTSSRPSTLLAILRKSFECSTTAPGSTGEKIYVLL